MSFTDGSASDLKISDTPDVPIMLNIIAMLGIKSKSNLITLAENSSKVSV